jgi:diacylglycerol kinase family enzyme
VLGLVIANPRATAGDPSRRNALLRTLSEVSRLKVIDTEDRGHATALARDAMRARHVDVVVGLGGDGTINEIVNGLLADGVHASVPALGVIPAGATNVFARSLGLPNNAEAATVFLRESLRSGLTRRINVGRLDGRYFIFCAGIGLDAAIIEHVEARRARGERSTLLLTASTAFRHLFGRAWPSLELRLPGGSSVDGLRWIVVSKSDPWTFINNRPLRPTPCASFDLGLEIYATRQMAPLELLRSAVRMTRRTPRLAGNGVHLEHDIDEFAVLAQEPTPVHVDGDMVGRRRTMQFRCVWRALRVFAPLPRIRGGGPA